MCPTRKAAVSDRPSPPPAFHPSAPASDSMKFHQPQAAIFVPDNTPLPDALARVTHLGIGAHQDDLEFMAFHGILECYQKPDAWFGGVTCTNGAGSSRTGPYASFTNERMMEIRRQEQD